MLDAIVIGGGPAGLQAALTLGRVHREVLVLDSGAYRNAPAAHMHNFVTHDGTAPSDFRKLAHRDLEAYPTVEVRPATAISAGPGDAAGSAYVVSTDAGDRLEARRLLLATGVRDVLPDVEGLAPLWGDLVHHCPFCHGHELAGRRVGIEAGPRADMLAATLGGIGAEARVLDDLVRVARDGDALRVWARGGETVVDGLFVGTTLEQASPLAAQLGLTLLPSGCVEVDPLGHTSRPGVLAAGDLAHLATLPMPLASVLSAAAAGQTAGAALHHGLVGEGL